MAKLPVFLSWSGERSKQVSLALHQWLPQVVQMVNPWMSTAIDAGTVWFGEIGARLRDTTVAILCITPENQNAPWINFEAGALGKGLEQSRVCPFLLGMAPTELTGPLSQFNARVVNKEGTYDLVRTLNGLLGEHAVTEEALKKTFSRIWNDFDQIIRTIGPPPKTEPLPDPRGDRDVLREILGIARRLEKRTPVTGGDLTPADRFRLAKDILRRYSSEVGRHNGPSPDALVRELMEILGLAAADADPLGENDIGPSHGQAGDATKDD